MQVLPTIAVVHLVWKPLGIDRFKRFLDSYQRFPAGVDHKLFIVLNGFSDQKETIPFKELLNERSIPAEVLKMEHGQDLEAYYFAANRSGEDLILFFNSYSEILYSEWLKKYAGVFKNESTGLISATGSWESYTDSILKNTPWLYEKDKTLVENFRKYKLLLKVMFYWRFLFKTFPNPHIRTNGFMIRRDIFLKCKMKKLKRRLQAYEFENGKNSLTVQVMKRGFNVYVVDKNGKAYEPGQWKEANVFWRSKQENLLVSDNQTMIYSLADDNKKKQLTIAAWGD